MNGETRIKKIKRKYGKDAFSSWGKKGGSPILRDFKKGKLVYRKK